MKKFLIVLLILFIGCDLVIGWVFGFKGLGLPHNELGRYFDKHEGIVYHDQCVPVNGLIVIFTIGLFVLALYLVIRLSKKASKGVLDGDHIY